MNENVKIIVKDNWKNILLVILFFIVVILVMSTTCTSNKLNIVENNLAAMNDTLHTYKMKNGELMYEKQGYILEKEELQKYLDISKSEVKDLEKKLGSALATISKLKTQVRVDTIHTIDSVYVDQDSVYNTIFRYNDNWLSLNGVTKFGFNPLFTKTTINNITMDANLKIGMSKDNKWFATSDNPYLNFTSIEGANLDSPKQKNWSLSLQFGLGAFVGYGKEFGVSSSGGVVAGAGFFAGIGISRKIVEF